MKKHMHYIAALGLGLLAATSAQAGSLCDGVANNLVTNCGFETGDFTGWTLSGNDVTAGQEGNLFGVEQGADPDGNAPNSGNYQAYFGDLISNATSLSQTLNTQAGDRYLVSFYVAQDTAAGAAPYGNNLDVTFGGTTVVDLNNIAVQGYTGYSFWETASSDSTTLNVTLGNGLGYFLLDDVSVAVPEPTSIAMVGLGLLALGASKRKSTKK